MSSALCPVLLVQTYQSLFHQNLYVTYMNGKVIQDWKSKIAQRSTTCIFAPQPFSQYELNVLIRDFDLTKNTLEFIQGVKKNLPGLHSTVYRRRKISALLWRVWTFRISCTPKRTFTKIYSLISIKLNMKIMSICGDIKLISIILVQQGKNTKFPVFFKWKSRDAKNHWKLKYMHEKRLVFFNKILFSHLHIKLGLIKPYVQEL